MIHELAYALSIAPPRYGPREKLAWPRFRLGNLGKSQDRNNIFDKMSGWDGMGGTTGSRDQRKFYVCMISKFCLSAGGWNKSRSAAPRGEDPAQRYDVWAV